MNEKRSAISGQRSAANKKTETFWQAIKKMFARRGDKCHSLQATLAPDKMLVAGNVTAEVVLDGGLLIKIGPDLAITVVPDILPSGLLVNDRFRIRCWSTGGRVAQVVKTEKAAGSFPPVNPEGTPTMPLVRTGPGGDYVRDWPENEEVVGSRA